MRLLLALLLLVGLCARVARSQCDPKTSTGVGPEGFCTCKNGFLGEWRRYGHRERRRGRCTEVLGRSLLECLG